MKRRELAMAGAAWAVGLPGVAFADASKLSQSALVIGNNAYPSSARLVNAAKDARLMHDTFTQLGASSVLHLDVSSKDLTRVIEDHVMALRKRPVPVAWFFFSGHGAYIDGKSFLLGTDTGSSSLQDLRTRSFDLDRLKNLLEQARPQVSIVVIDACRNNPFLTRGFSVSTAGVVPSKWGGSIVAFSTAPYTKAFDWPDRPNGPYATALSAALLAREPRLLEQAFTQASDQVYAATGKEQLPGYYSELHTRVFLEGGTLTAHQIDTAGSQMVSGKPAGLARGMVGGFYRSDFPKTDAYADTTADFWARMTDELEVAARSPASHATNSALLRAKDKRAADSDLALAGLLLEQGRGVPRDRAQAARYYERAAQRGFVTAQLLRGELAYSQKDDAAAYKWISLAARSSWTRAQIDLAQLLAEGRGTAPDPAAAARQMMEALRGLSMPTR